MAPMTSIPHREKGEVLTAKLGGNSEFARVDIDDVNSLETALKSKIALATSHRCSLSCAYELKIDHECCYCKCESVQM